MKKLLIGITFIALFASQALYASPKIFKPHKGLKGKDAATLNCGYCHSKAGIAKKKGQDLVELNKGPYCATGDCHKPQ